MATLIVIDGADNVGKATQTALLRTRLQNDGRKVGTLDFPRYDTNTFGRLIRESLDGAHGNFMDLDPKIASALYAADRFESKSVLQDLLDTSDVVILDRYVSANMLHQGAKIDSVEKRREFIMWLEHVEYEIFGMPKPDHTIALLVSFEDSEAIREKMIEDGVKSKDTAEADKEHQRRVCECVSWLSAVREDWTAVHCSSVEGLRSREDIHEEIYKNVITLL